jgi:hypothetical protein
VLISESSGKKISSIDSYITLSGDSPGDCPLLAIGRFSSYKTPSDNSINTIYLLEGELVNDFMKYNRRFHLILTESLEVHLDLEDESASTTRKEPLGYSVKRFTADSIKYLSETCPIVDVRQLEGEVLCPLSEDNAFCLVAGDVVLKINTHG